MIGIRYCCTVNTFKNIFRLNWNRKLLIHASCVSFEIVDVIWRLQPVLAHASCVVVIAGFGKIGVECTV